MKEEKRYQQTKIIARQLCDIMQKRDLQDITELKEWLEKNSAADEVIQKLMSGTEITREIENYRQEDKEREAKLLRTRIHRYQLRRRMTKLIGIAAAVLITAGIWLWNSSDFRGRGKMPEMVITSAASSPMLILSNGKNINLSANVPDSLFLAIGTNIVYKNNKELKYNQESEESERTKEESLNQLIIPRQCNYQVVLSDGSVVRLNAESRLSYPDHFANDVRRVYLQGEGYFEVKQDGRPFVVEVNRVTIRVYGTKFNVNAYEDDHVKTVLVDGKVGVSLPNITEQILKPHQLSDVDLNMSEQKITDVAVEKYISWTTGFLRYDNDRLEVMIKDLSRWYGEDFIFIADELKEIRISASVNKDTPLTEVLTMIQSTAKIKFKQTERRYIISR